MTLAVAPAVASSPPVQPDTGARPGSPAPAAFANSGSAANADEDTLANPSAPAEASEGSGPIIDLAPIPVADSAVDQPTPSLPPNTPQLDDRLRIVIREEFQKAIDATPPDPRDFEFKVSTVKWFGILCAIALVLILAANAYFINQLFETGRKHEPAIQFQPMMNGGAADRIYEIAVENEALNMRNNRSVSALFMRAYTQFLSVTAGTILAMLGAIFVLARVDSRETRTEASWKEFRWLINTASPGVLLACLGVALVGFVAYRSITPIDTTDTPIFHGSALVAAHPRLEDILASDEFKQQMDQDLAKLRANQ